MEEAEHFVCPKCGYEDGNYWSQCEGSCPIPSSPVYDKDVKPSVVFNKDGSYEIHYQPGVFSKYDKDRNLTHSVNCPYIPEWMGG